MWQLVVTSDLMILYGDGCSNAHADCLRTFDKLLGFGFH